MKIPFLPTKATLFHIGGSDELGQFTKPITGRMPLNELRIEIAEIFDLIPIEEKQEINYVINPVDLLKSFTDNVVKEIRMSNQDLFHKLITRQENGIFRSFGMDYERILDGALEDGNRLPNDLNEIFMHHKNLFFALKDFIYNDNNHGIRFQSNIHNVAAEFGILINILLMSITVQFKRKGSKKYFNNSTVIPTDIQEIKFFLLSMLGGGSNQKLVDFLVWGCLKEPLLVQKYEKAMDLKLSDEEKRQLLLSVISSSDNWNVPTSTDSYCTYKHHELTLTNTLVNHYNMLLDLISYIKLVEKLHIALCKSNEDSGEFPKEFLFMIESTKTIEE